MTILKGILVIASILSLISLCFYILFAAKGNSLTLYLTINSKNLSVQQGAFLVFAAIGFLVCMYNGAYAMLFWMPHEWGSINSDGEYQTTRATLAGLFTFIGGLGFMQFIDRASRERFFLVELQEKMSEMNEIIKFYDNEAHLTHLKTRYLDKIETLKLNLAERKHRATPFSKEPFRIESPFPEERRIFNYYHLIKVVEQQLHLLKNV